MVELRNICAHYSRLYNMPLKQKPRLYSEHRKYYSSSRLNKLFPTLIVLKRMTYSSGYWTKFENQLKPLMKAYNDVIKLSFIGFPRDWENVLKNVVASNPSTPKGRLWITLHACFNITFYDACIRPDFIIYFKERRLSHDDRRSLYNGAHGFSQW